MVKKYMYYDCSFLIIHLSFDKAFGSNFFNFYTFFDFRK